MGPALAGPPGAGIDDHLVCVAEDPAPAHRGDSPGCAGAHSHPPRYQSLPRHPNRPAHHAQAFPGPELLHPTRPARNPSGQYLQLTRPASLSERHGKPARTSVEVRPRKDTSKPSAIAHSRMSLGVPFSRTFRNPSVIPPCASSFAGQPSNARSSAGGFSRESGLCTFHWQINIRYLIRRSPSDRGRPHVLDCWRFSFRSRSSQLGDYPLSTRADTHRILYRLSLTWNFVHHSDDIRGHSRCATVRIIRLVARIAYGCNVLQ